MKISKYSVLLILFVFLLNLLFAKGDDRKAVDIVKSVIEKIISESTFKFSSVLQEEAVGVQIIDFKREFGNKSGAYFALANLYSDTDTVLNFGISYSGGIKIWIDNNLVFEGLKNTEAEIKEIAYGLFSYDSTVNFDVKKGSNKILIKLVSGLNKPIVYFREIPETAETKMTASFKNFKQELSENNKKWLVVGPFNLKENIINSLKIKYPPEFSIKDYYKYGANIIAWNTPKDNLLRKLVIKESSSYKRESYLEWHYANGATMFSILSAADKTNEKSYEDFVKRFCDLIIVNYDYYKYEYKELNALRGTNHRIFRKTMLDDTCAPALPFVQLYLDNRTSQFEDIVFEMSDYLEYDQVRLNDGTLCRPEPVEMTVWADDLFMSVPFLLRMAEITENQKYYDDAAFQVVRFNELLFDESIGLYKHGWFENENKKSVAYWGRANGWIIWAATEALIHLPKDHKLYSKILRNYQSHVNGLVKQQSNTGMWHQVLNKKDSFKETSCSAMFTMGILRGIKHGWLDKSFTEYALKAWNEIKYNIKNDGTVIDICRGTGIGYDHDFYYKRKRFDNDPRGLGAVIQAALEVSEFE